MAADTSREPGAPPYRPSPSLDLWREGDERPVAVKEWVALEQVRLQETHRTRRGAMTQVFVLGLSSILASVVFGVLGLVLVILAGDEAHSTVDLFDQSIGTDSVGVACLFMGAVAFVVSLRSVLRTMNAMVGQAR